MSNRGSNAEFPDVELQQEQEFIDGLYARVDVLRGDTEASVGDALAQGNTPMQARLERDVLVAERSGLLAALNAVDGSLCFGRIDLTSGVSHHIGRIGVRADDTEHTPSSSTGGHRSPAPSTSPPGTPRWTCAAAGTSVPRGAG